MLGTLLVIFAILAISITLLLICLCAVSCMGMLGFITPFLLKVVSVFHDKPYTEEQDPINNECFICIEKIQNEVVATCNHSFCGTCQLIQDSALHAISRRTSITRLIVQRVGRKCSFFFEDSKRKMKNRKGFGH